MFMFIIMFSERERPGKGGRDRLVERGCERQRKNAIKGGREEGRKHDFLQKLINYHTSIFPFRS